jgi:hypothetical protein
MRKKKPQLEYDQSKGDIGKTAAPPPKAEINEAKTFRKHGN